MFCPVPNCLHANLSEAAGWDSVANMRDHLDSHSIGQIPLEWRLAHRLVRCEDCGKLAVGPPGTRHPTCRARARTEHSQASAAEQASANHFDAGRARPTADTVLRTKRPTLRHVPKCCRDLWATALTRVFASAHLATIALGSNPSQEAVARCEEAWLDVLLLPKCVLCPSARSGRRHRKLTGQHTRARLNRWLAGERQSLWEDSTPKKSNRPSNGNTAAERRRRALALVEENRLGPASAALTSEGAAPGTVETRSALSSKHPTGRAPAPDAAPPRLTESCPQTPEDVLKALGGFPKGSGGGPSGLRPQHLLEGVKMPCQRLALEALTDALNTLLAGRVPTSMAPFLAGASLHALNKDGGDVRPIAVGEAVRRLASKCACAKARESATEYLVPLQVGVGCAFGAEAVIHAVSQYCRRNRNAASKLVLKVDFANAFNTVDRETFLRACQEITPEVSKWAWWCYSQPSHLYYGEGPPLASSAGVQQGDNLGPLLFSLALQPTLERLAALRGAGGLDIVAGYLDDVVVAGDHLAVLEALRILHDAAPGIGLHLKLEKCELIPTAGANTTANLAAFPANIKRKLDGNFDLLGAPIGDCDHCCSYLREKRLLPAQAKLAELRELGDAHAAYKILSACLGSCKMMYAMRTTRPEWASSVMQDFDSIIRETLESTLGSAIDDESWRQAQLSTSSGGLGLRSADAHATAAFLASSTCSAELCQKIDPGFTWNESGLGTVARQYNASVPATKWVAVDQQPSEGEGGLKQSDLSEALEDAQFASLKAQGSTEDKARLEAAAAAHAGAWLNAPATRAAGLRLTTAEFAVAALLRIGGRILSRERWCPKCDQQLTQRAHHAVRCRAGGDITVRHNSLRDECFFRCGAAGFEAERETTGLLREATRRRPGDVVIQSCPGMGAIALDFAVTCPLQATLLAESAQHPLAAARSYEAHKMEDRRTAQQCAAAGLTLVPMVAETLGGWGPAAQNFFRNLAKAAADRQGIDASIASCQIYESMGIRLQRANARAVLSRTSALLTSCDNTAIATTRSEAALVLSAATPFTS